MGQEVVDGEAGGGHNIIGVRSLGMKTAALSSEAE